MVKELVVYPDNRILACSDVRSFNESLDRLFEDMYDTMKEHNLTALSAIQIARPYNVIIIQKANGEYLELINPRILSTKGRFESTEQTSYYPDITIKVPRYEEIKLIYEDRDGNQKHMDIKDKELSATIQRKIDYTFGGTPLDKVDKNYKEQILKALAGKGLMPESVDVCPMFSKKDYITSFTDKILFFMGLSLLTPLFDFEAKTVANIYMFDKFAFPLVLILMVVYFVYAQYEAKKYKQCSSCQIGNQIGIIAKRVVLATVLAIGAKLVFG